MADLLASATDDSSGISSILRQVTDLWWRQIKLCEDKKQRDFGRAAREIRAYTGKRYRRIGIEPIVDGVPQNPLDLPEYITVHNMTQAAIDVLTPYVFARVPNRLVAPRRPQIPPELDEQYPDAVQMQSVQKKNDTMTCFLLQWLLNWTPSQYNMAREGKMAVEEAIATGRSCLWLEMMDCSIGTIPGSFQDSVDNLLIDADCVQMRDAGFIIRKRRMQNWRIADIFGEDLEDLRSTESSALARAIDVDPDASHRPEPPEKGDIGYFYEFWSQMGLGDKLVSAPQEMKEKEGPIRALFDAVGPYVHFCIMPGVDHPLGIKPDEINALADRPDEQLELVKAKLRWPIRTYENLDNPWPVFCLDFKPNNDNPWAKSILESGLPLQKFIDEIYQGLMQRAKVVGKDIVIMSAAVEEALQQALKENIPFEMVKVGDAAVDKSSMEKLVHILQFPPMNKDVIPILELAERCFEKLTGLDPSMFGGITRTQDRSAKASSMRQAGLARRPDDYADIVEAWQSAVSAGEASAARQELEDQTFATFAGEQIIQTPAMGEGGALPTFTSYWHTLVHTDDPAIAEAECAYTVEAGSGRRRNKQLLQENAQQLYTMLGQQFYAYGELSENFKPFLALVQLVGEAFDMPVQPLIEKFEEAIAQQMAMQQAAAATGGGQPGQGAPPGQGGMQAGVPANAEPGAGRVQTSWARAAGGPKPMTLPPPPGTQG